jgi:hypothetical protein
MLIFIGISEANHFVNTKTVDVKILVAGGLATGFLALAGSVPGFGPVAAGIAWVAVAAELLGIGPGAQQPAPYQNFAKLAGGL